MRVLLVHTLVCAISKTLSFHPVPLSTRPHVRLASLPPATTDTPTASPLIPTIYKAQTKFVVDQVVNTTSISSVYVRHCLTATREAADEVLALIKQKSSYVSDIKHITADPFGEVTALISNCEATKDKGGDIGWLDRTLVPSESSYDASAIFPDQLRRTLFEDKRMKPGDVYIMESVLGFHITKVGDVTVAKDAEPTVRRPKPVLKGLGKTSASPDLSSAKSYSIMTHGCQMNAADSERLSGQLAALGLERAEDERSADVVVLNTCSIRDHAQSKVYDELGPIARRKRNGESVALVVSGCVAQQEGEDLIKRVPEVDLVMGPQHINRLGDLLEDVGNGHQLVSTEQALISEDISRPERGDEHRAWVNIIFGCNEHCSYCVVPNTRGVEQSRPVEYVFNEVQELGRRGYKEVTLLGQNIDAYGRDLSPKSSFADLLAVVNKAEGIERIRYVTSHPRYFSPRVISAVRDLDKVCEQFHLPPQAGSDGVLKNMRRGYTFDSYMKIVDNIRELCPDASITGDIIVGFPGETEEDFQRTLDLMERVHYDNLNSFAYSPRPYTDAALSSHQVPDVVKAERLQRVQRLGAVHGQERSNRYVGRKVEVLVEGPNPKNTEEEVRGGLTRASKGQQAEMAACPVFVNPRRLSLVGDRSSGALGKDDMSSSNTIDAILSASL